jgi:hypothetical protein
MEEDAAGASHKKFGVRSWELGGRRSMREGAWKREEWKSL